MNIIEHGSSFDIFSEGIKTHKELPINTYRVVFSQMQGYSLTKTDDFEITEKIYGNNTDKIEKIFKSYQTFDRSMGVILSGDKGIGKSLFTKVLAKESLNRGIPVLIVSEETPGLPDFLDSIEQDCLVLFDEFEKVFKEQDKLLSLFDGYSTQKKLYAITINNVYKLSEYMVNRPGRFHYHFRFPYPSETEIREYMNDKVDNKYQSEITKVVRLAKRMKLNYDYLRAISFELNLGSTLKESLEDLNILNINQQELEYTVEFYLKGYEKPFVIKNYERNFLDDRTVIDFMAYNNEGETYYMDVSIKTENLKDIKEGFEVTDFEVRQSELVKDEEDNELVELEKVVFTKNKEKQRHKLMV